MMEIELPDGSIAEFPDGTSNDVIKGALRKRFGAQIKVDPATGQPPGVPEFNPGVEGYDPKSGLVQKHGMLGSAAAGAADIATMGFGDEASAAIATLLDKLPGMKGQGYGENLAEIRGNQASAQADNPNSYLAGQIGGGIAQGAVAGPSMVGSTLGRTAARSALAGALMGGVQGVGSGTDASSRAVGGAAGSLVGAGLGGAAPYAIAGGRAALSPIVAPIMARLRPDSYANAALGESLRRSGSSVDDITNALMAARGDGQDMFTVADAMGNAGQRMLSTAARNPHDGRQAVIEALQQRQVGQGERLSNALAEGFNAPDTAAQRSAGLVSARGKEANINYGKARENAGPVDVRSAIAAIDEKVPPTINPEGIADNSVYKTVRGIRNMLTPNKGEIPESVPAPAAAGLSYDDAIAKLNRNGSRQEARVLNQLTPSGGRRPPAPQSLSEFVAARGGILDHQGEAASIAGGVKTRHGKIVRDDGKLSLDYMREAAEEAGYLHDYTSDEFGRASVDDFLRALDDDVRGTKVFSRQNLSDEGALDEWSAATAARDSMRGNLDRIGQETPGRVSDDVVSRAAQIMESEQIAPDEAIQRAIHEDIAANGIEPQTIPAGMFPDAANPGAKTPAEPILDFDRAFLTKQEIDAIMEKGGVPAGLLRDARKNLDEALASASGPYSKARDAFRLASKNIDAVDAGRAAASGRTRAADNIQSFNGMNQEQQSAFRAGYVDPMIAKVESSSVSPTTNKARPLMTEKTGQEFPAFAHPGRAGQMGERIGREQRMFETANAALGGSKTADNLADAADMARFDPSVMSKLLRGDPVGAAIAAVSKALNEARGMPPSVIHKVADALMETDPDAARMLLQAGSNKTAQTSKQRAVLGAILTNLGASGAARALPAP